MDKSSTSSGHRGIHTIPNRGITVEWMTPPEVLAALGQFDLDPCAHPKQPWQTATQMIRPPEDGLAATWNGRVWLNPPYGENHLWLKKMMHHGNGIALVASRTEVDRWFVPYVWEGATAVLFLYGRLYFHYPDGGRAKGNAGHGTVLAAYGEANAKSLEKCGLRGRFLRIRG